MKSGLTIDEVTASELRGSVRGSFVRAPHVTISAGEDTLAEIETEQAGESGKWLFTWRLPVKLFDGTVRVLRAASGDAESFIGFVGDPRLAARASSPASIPVPELPASLDSIRKQTRTLGTLLDGNAATGGRVARRGPTDLLDRHGALFADACLKMPGARDFLWFGVINYGFRTQRPQHLVEGIADNGNRVFYLSINFESSDEGGRFRITEMPHHGVFILQLRVDGQPPKNIYAGFTQAQVQDIQKSLDAALLLLNVSHPVAVVQYPSWYEVAMGIPGATVVHDCLDYVGGFSNVPSEMVALERKLIENADLVITTAEPLAEHVREIRDTVVIRNAADFDFFARAADFDQRRDRKRRPVIGYFGAIAEWFEVEWIDHCARRRPDWDFVLIGQTVGADVDSLKKLKNVSLLGERPYKSLPDHLQAFDVAVIPFHLTELTRCTNPVKLYEYMAAGKPVVASPMPEVVGATPLVYIAHDANEFEKQIERALLEDSPNLRRKRNAWASEHTWENRSGAFLDALPASEPTVSVIVLAYNHWDFTKACLHSVRSLSDYPNLEIVVVDNGSTDETPDELAHLARCDARIKVVRNDANLGFAAGNNAGIAASSGEIIILLNNDTYVTRGWIADLIRPLRQHSNIGLVGPLTNNIGNEQKISINYADMQAMAIAARRFTRNHIRKRLSTDNLAFFCVATRRDVIERVGLLDAAFGRGFFEDDDYCMRVRKAGYRLVVADDIFVHHHLSASFDALGAKEKQAQMVRNRALFEERWGPWKPHAYRNAPGFGG